jgi:Leucine-rich repeat (LRR) protein
MRSVWLLKVILFFALSSSLSCSGYDCTIGEELCSCEKVNCENYKKILPYCEIEYYGGKYCDESDNYIYSDVFCNLTSVVCVEKKNGEYVLDLSLFLNSNEKLNFSIRYKVMTHIKTNFFRGLSISSLDISYNHIKQIDEAAFEKTHGLKELNVSINQIEKIKFNNLSELEILDARKNMIKKIDSKDLSSMPKIKVLYLNYNDIDFIASDAFDLNPDLKNVDIKSNNVFELHQFPSLNLSYNQLALLLSGVFSPLFKLLWLSLEMNPIATIHFDCFLGVDQLSYLKIQSITNEIKTIPLSPDKKIVLTKLNTLIFNHDSAKLIRLFDLTRIQKISLDYCEMDFNISRQLNFKDMNQIYLQKLRLIGNLSLNNYLRDFGEHLLEIDLSFNSIDFKEPNQFISKSNSLEKLWMAGVNITFFEKALNLTIFNKLLLLDLSNNLLEIIKEDYLKINFELNYLNFSNISTTTHLPAIKS